VKCQCALFEEDTKENFEERRGIGQSVCPGVARQY
jgi:hypothetical protein